MNFNYIYHENTFKKFLNFFPRYETDYRAGVSKTWIREYQKEKYGYGGTYQYSVIGSKNSSMPLEVNLAISSTYMNSYWTNNLNIRLRIEGVSKCMCFIQKFALFLNY